MDCRSLKLSVDKAINENFMALFEMEEISLQVRPYLNGVGQWEYTLEDDITHPFYLCLLQGIKWGTSFYYMHSNIRFCPSLGFNAME